MKRHKVTDRWYGLDYQGAECACGFNVRRNHYYGNMGYVEREMRAHLQRHWPAIVAWTIHDMIRRPSPSDSGAA